MVSHCARRTRPFSGRAFREHRTNMGAPSHPFHRARSASKKGTWPLPLHPTPLPKYSLWVYHEPGHQGTVILMGIWVSVVKLVLG